MSTPVKLLFDNNLSPKLVVPLASLYPQSAHVADFGLQRASDLAVWDVARRDKFMLVSKDSDFVEILNAKGFPPKVIWLRLGNCGTETIIQTLIDYHPAILEFHGHADSGLLEIFGSFTKN